MSEVEALRRRVVELENELRTAKANGGSTADDADSLLKALVTSLPGAAVFVVDPDLRYRLAGGEALYLAGLTPGHIIGRQLRDVVPPSLLEETTSIYRKALSGESFILEHELHGRVFLTRGVPLRNASGAVFAALAVSHDITDRRRAEDARQLSEERFRTVVITSSSVVWTTDSEGSIVEENASWAAFTGRTFEEYKGWAWLEDIHPNDRERTADVWREALASRTLYQTEYRLRRHDGAYRHMIARGAPVLEADGSLREWVGACTDIDERVQARRKLEFLDNLAEATRELSDPGEVMVVITRLLGEDLQVSRCAYADVEADTDRFTILHDYTVEGCASSAGNYHLSLFGPRAAADQRKGCTLVIDDVDDELVPGEGAAMFNAIGIKAIVCCPLLKRGRLTAMMAVHQTTPRKWTVDEVALVEATVERAWAYIERSRANRRLAASEERLQQVFEQAPVAVAVLRGPELVYELANSYHQMFLPDQALVGRPIREVLPDLDPEIIDVMRRVLDTGEPFSASELRMQFERNGIREDRWFNVLFQPLLEPEGMTASILSVSVDVSDQVLARMELERMNRELEEFAYVASHDLQEPLRMINIYTQQIIRRMGEPDEALNTFAGFIQRGVTRMESLIQDLLSYSRTIQKDEEPVGTADLTVSLAEAITVLRTRIEESGTILHAPTLPAVHGDTQQMALVFQNLLSNSLKYRRPDVAPEIHITADRNDKQWKISVRDNGIGFEQKYADRVFGLFKRLHTTEYPGTGLGLAICQRIIERYRGRMWAEGRPGEGATFFFTLPAAEN